MGRLTWSINVTLDGCCDHREAIADEELHRYATGLLRESDGVLLGRVTYELFESYWPSVAASGLGSKAEVDFARELNSRRRYVASRTLHQLAWENAFLIAGDLAHEIRQLTQGDGCNLLMFGSPGLASTLAQLGLIDEYHILVQPIVAGHDPTLFQGSGQRLQLSLTGMQRFGSGVVVLRYAPA